MPPYIAFIYIELVIIPWIGAAGLKALLWQSLEAVVATIRSEKMNGESWSSWLGCLRYYLKQTQNDFGLEEHFWARPSSSKVGTELDQKLELNWTKVGTELAKVGTELSNVQCRNP